MFGFLGRAASAVNPFKSRAVRYQSSGAADDGGGDDDDENPLLGARSDLGGADATPGLISQLASDTRGGNRGRNRQTKRRGAGRGDSSDDERGGDVNADRHSTAMYSLGPANTAATGPRANRPGIKEPTTPYMDAFAAANFTHDNDGNQLSAGMAASRRSRADRMVNPTNAMDGSGGVGASWGVGAGGGGVSSGGGGWGMITDMAGGAIQQLSLYRKLTRRQRRREG